MRSLLYITTFMAIIALAFWAYRENHLTRQSMAQMRALEREIVALQQAIAVQHAEWAYLNRPDRLRELADLNFEQLGLMPMQADHFGTIGTIPYPLPATLGGLERGIEVSGEIELMSSAGATPDAAPLQEDQTP